MSEQSAENEHPQKAAARDLMAALEASLGIRCEGTLGSKPWWMGWGQYDPCRCDLPAGHPPSSDDPSGHSCEHVRPHSVSEDGQ